MGTARPKTATEINVETVKQYVDNFVEKTKHLLDEKLELPLAKPKKPEWDENFTLDKSDEQLAKVGYAHHAAAALHFVGRAIKKSLIVSNQSALLNRLKFLQAFNQENKVRYGFAPRVVDENTRLLADEFLGLVNNLAALADPLDGIIGSFIRWTLGKFSKKSLVEDLKDYFKVIQTNLVNQINRWDVAHPKSPRPVSSVAVVMTVIPDLKKQSTPRPPEAPPVPPVRPAPVAVTITAKIPQGPGQRS